MKGSVLYIQYKKKEISEQLLSILDLEIYRFGANKTCITMCI